MTTEPSQTIEPLLRYADLLLRKGMQEEAALQLQEILRQAPGCADAHYGLAVVRSGQGHREEAAAHFQEVLAAQPGDVRALNGLGVVFQQLGRIDEAAACYREAVRLDPRHQDALINFAILLKDHGRLCLAQRQLEEALKLQPDAVRLWYNLANNLQLQGRSVEAVAAYRETLRLEPNHPGAQQNLLFALHYSSRFSDREIYLEHLAAAARPAFAPAAVSSGPVYVSNERRGTGAEHGAFRGGVRGQGGIGGQAPAEPVPGRIRIGYLSPDFRGHSVASFIEPILAQHDRSRFEVHCYANLARPDATTERLQGHAECWRELYGVGDQEAARLIAADGIDILVDLAGHTSGNRLALMAQRPAPLQVTWIGYPDTTALAALDYRITDRLADPPGWTERYHSERLVRLERSFLCYQPPVGAPAVAPLPALTTGRVTFGSFNNLAKVTPELIALWSRLLQALPGSRLLMKCPPLSDAEVCVRVLEEFRGCGVGAERIELHPGNPSPAEHLAEYGRVDIALDTFPYNGTTTTCEALWMGVPVVTLAGTRHASRTGASLLTNCGFSDLVALSPEEYLAVALELARDLAGLARLREGMREQLRRSPLLDAAGVTREVEEAYLAMLQESCGRAA